MYHITMSRFVCSSAVLSAIVMTALGCGGQSAPSAAPDLAKPDEVAAALPKGITLETPVVGEARYGASSKTVKEALASLNAQVIDGVLTAGYVGPQIHFDNEPPDKLKPSRTGKQKESKPPIVIRLAH